MDSPQLSYELSNDLENKSTNWRNGSGKLGGQRKQSGRDYKRRTS